MSLLVQNEGLQLWKVTTPRGGYSGQETVLCGGIVKGQN